MCTTCHSFSVTLRRGLPTSRRQFYMSLSRRDVDFPRRDVNFYPLCHVATSVFTSLCHIATLPITSRRQFLQVSVTSRRCPSRRDVSFYKSLSRRDVTPHVATSLSYMLSNVATLTRTSRCWLHYSLSRRDVTPHVATLTRTSRCWLHYSLSRRDVTPHVATLPCFKPKNGSFLALHLTHSTNRNPSFLAHQPSPDLPELPSHRSEVPPLLSDHLCTSQSHPLHLVPGHCGISTIFHSALALVGSSRVSLHSQLVQGPLWSKFRVFLGFRVLSHS